MAARAIDAMDAVHSGSGVGSSDPHIGSDLPLYAQDTLRPGTSDPDGNSEQDVDGDELPLALAPSAGVLLMRDIHLVRRVDCMTTSSVSKLRLPVPRVYLAEESRHSRLAGESDEIRFTLLCCPPCSSDLGLDGEAPVITNVPGVHCNVTWPSVYVNANERERKLCDISREVETPNTWYEISPPLVCTVYELIATKGAVPASLCHRWASQVATSLLELATINACHDELSSGTVYVAETSPPELIFLHLEHVDHSSPLAVDTGYWNVPGLLGVSRDCYQFALLLTECLTGRLLTSRREYSSRTILPPRITAVPDAAVSVSEDQSIIDEAARESLGVDSKLGAWIALVLAKEKAWTDDDGLWLLYELLGTLQEAGESTQEAFDRVSREASAYMPSASALPLRFRRRVPTGPQDDIEVHPPRSVHDHSPSGDCETAATHRPKPVCVKSGVRFDAKADPSPVLGTMNLWQDSPTAIVILERLSHAKRGRVERAKLSEMDIQRLLACVENRRGAPRCAVLSAAILSSAAYENPISEYVPHRAGGGNDSRGGGKKRKKEKLPVTNVQDYIADNGGVTLLFRSLLSFPGGVHMRYAALVASIIKVLSDEWNYIDVIAGEILNVADVLPQLLVSKVKEVRQWVAATVKNVMYTDAIRAKLSCVVPLCVAALKEETDPITACDLADAITNSLLAPENLRAVLDADLPTFVESELVKYRTLVAGASAKTPAKKLPKLSAAYVGKVRDLIGVFEHLLWNMGVSDDIPDALLEEQLRNSTTAPKRPSTSTDSQPATVKTDRTETNSATTTATRKRRRKKSTVDGKQVATRSGGVSENKAEDRSGRHAAGLSCYHPRLQDTSTWVQRLYEPCQRIEAIEALWRLSSTSAEFPEVVLELGGYFVIIELLREQPTNRKKRSPQLGSLSLTETENLYYLLQNCTAAFMDGICDSLVTSGFGEVVADALKFFSTDVVKYANVLQYILGTITNFSRFYDYCVRLHESGVSSAVLDTVIAAASVVDAVDVFTKALFALSDLSEYDPIRNDVSNAMDSSDFNIFLALTIADLLQLQWPQVRVVRSQKSAAHLVDRVARPHQPLFWKLTALLRFMHLMLDAPAYCDLIPRTQIFRLYSHFTCTGEFDGDHIVFKDERVGDYDITGDAMTIDYHKCWSLVQVELCTAVRRLLSTGCMNDSERIVQQKCNERILVGLGNVIL